MCPRARAEKKIEELSHTQIQWMLGKFGQQIGYQVWIAANDRNKEYKGKKLGEISIDKLPSLALDDDFQKAIELIDVVLLKGKQVAAAFEIEHTTSIYSGLLRMHDLAISAPNSKLPLYIIAPENRIGKVRKELSRPTFKTLKINDRCGFFSAEALLAQYDKIIEWATDLSAIEKLASKFKKEE